MPLGWLHFFGNWNYTVVTFKTFLLEILAISCLLCPDLAAWEVTNLYSISGLLINAASQQIALKRKWLSQEGILCCQEKKWLFLNKPTLWFGLTFLPLMHSGEVNQGTIYLECVWWRSACFYMRVPWRRWFMRGEHLFRDHLCASMSVCVCVGAWALLLTQTNRQWGKGYCTCNTGAKVKFRSRQNSSFVNGTGLIIIHYETRQTLNPKGLVYYSVFVSEEQTLHRD